MAVTALMKPRTGRNSYIPVRRGQEKENKKISAKADIGASRMRSGGYPIADHGGFGHLRNVLVWCLGLLVVLLLSAGISLGLVRAYQFCISSPFFAIEHITIQGNKYLKNEEILAIADLQKGQNILTIRILDIENELLQNPWVEKVTIRRTLPNSFEIVITERDPSFWILRDGKVFYLDSSGLIISPVNKNNFVSLPTLDISPGGEIGLSEMSNFMEQLELSKLPFNLSQISWLKLSAGKGYEMYWETKDLSLCIGFEDWKKNMYLLTLAVIDMEKRNEISMVKEFRAADGQVWIDPR